MVSKARTIAPQIEKRARFIAHHLIDSKLADLIFLPYNPRGFRIFVSQKKKGSKKELKWMVIKGPKQLDGVMCGYFVMRYMRDIIANRSLLKSQFEGKKIHSRAELDEMRSE